MDIRKDAWRGFKGTHWTDDINVRDFIQNNYTVYTGDESFLAGPTEGTDKLWGKLQELQKEERARGGVRCLYTGDAKRKTHAYYYRSSGYIRPRTNCRRLQKSCPLRYRFSY